MDTDTFLTVSPGGSILYTADADVIRQILSRVSDFPKPTFLYRNVDIFGKNVVTTEGAAWKRHRRLVAPAISERNNQLVWEETIRQTRALVRAWADVEGKIITTAQRDTMSLSLNVIGRAGFGRDMGLVMNESEKIGIRTGMSTTSEGKSNALPEGHSMTFVNSLGHLLDNILSVVILPKWFLSKSCPGTKYALHTLPATSLMKRQY
jgi:cytochrome P450